MSSWHLYGHAEEGSSYWQWHWGEHADVGDRGRYRHDLFAIGRLQAYSKVDIDFLGSVNMPGGKPYTLVGYGIWDQ